MIKIRINKHGKEYVYENIDSLMLDFEQDSLVVEETVPTDHVEAAAAAPGVERARTHMCDKCGAPMALRTGKKGAFWGCTGFPKCRNTFDA